MGAADTLLFEREGYIYFTGSNSDFYRVPMYSNIDGYGDVQLLAEETTAAGISCDYAAGYFTYFALVDEWASDYTYFYKVDGYEGLEPQFVGKRAEADIPTKEQIEEASK
ncbi:MAG: hypothetical protein K2M48_06035 [Clostridiales bacterium]|nr:hypothetical protein [Clostridiales bacterium]